MAARYVPYDQLGETPNIIVDGAANAHTVLTLSHWPGSGTPAPLLRDTSTQIAFAYLDATEHHVPVEVVSNNHFDEDGLLGLFVLLKPEQALAHRELLEDAASAGDFGTFRRREAARMAFTIAAYSDPLTSPLPREIFALPGPRRDAALYRHLLPLVPSLYSHLEEYRRYWYEQDQFLGHSEQLLASGDIGLEEEPELDLAVVRFPAALSLTLGQALAQQNPFGCHSYALHNRTACNRLVLAQAARMEFHYRYESWVQMASRRPLPRVDLSTLAQELTRLEPNGARWVFDGVDRITPRLYCADRAGSGLPLELFLRRLRGHLQAGAPAWDPYSASAPPGG